MFSIPTSRIRTVSIAAFAVVVSFALGACNSSNSTQKSNVQSTTKTSLTSSDKDAAKARWEGIMKRIETAVANGDMTREQANERYASIKKRMAQRDVTKGNARAEAYLNDVGIKIKAAIANGEMTEEEGKTKYAASVQRIKKRMAGASKREAMADDSKRFTKEEYGAAAAKMVSMVKAGEITREQMQQRLDRMSKAMASKDDEDRDAWAGFKRRIEAAVESGVMTLEESREAYEGFRRRMAARDDQREKLSDDCMALRRKLGEAVRNGEMTREEAGKIWEDEGC